MHFPFIFALPSPPLPSRNVSPSVRVRPTVIFSSHFFDGASTQILSPSVVPSLSVMCTNFSFFSISAQQPTSPSSSLPSSLPSSIFFRRRRHRRRCPRAPGWCSAHGLTLKAPDKRRGEERRRASATDGRTEREGREEGSLLAATKVRSKEEAEGYRVAGFANLHPR